MLVSLDVSEDGFTEVVHLEHIFGEDCDIKDFSSVATLENSLAPKLVNFDHFPKQEFDPVFDLYDCLSQSGLHIWFSFKF